MAENSAIKHQMVTRAGVSAILKCLVAPIDVSALIVEILMGAPRLPSKTLTASHLTASRYRPKQKLQEVKESSSSLEYLMKQGLLPVTGWSDIESLTLDCLVNFASLKGLSIEPSKVHEYYSRLQVISKNLGSVCPLQPKKVKQIDGKLQCIKKMAKGFEALYKKQVELNWF